MFARKTEENHKTKFNTKEVEH